MKIIDVKGLQCPLPLIKTKKALNEIEEGEALKIIVDNANSVTNVLRFLKDNNQPVEQTQNGDITELIINSKNSDIKNVEVESYCTNKTKPENDFILVFAKNKIGEGAEELGKMLVSGFLSTFKEMNKLPQKVIFLNSGIELVLKNSSSISILKEYENKGVELLICGTCLEYYKKSEEVVIGKVSNAYDILNATLNAGKVINF